MLSLDAAGLSSRRIVAALAGQGLAISLSTVLRMLAGAHCQPPCETIEPGETRVSPRRCGECGGRIDIAPCRACRLLAAIPRRRRRSPARSEHGPDKRRTDADATAALTMDLSAHHRRRFEAIQRQRASSHLPPKGTGTFRSPGIGK